MVEHRVYTAGVVGSSPAGPTLLPVRSTSTAAGRHEGRAAARCAGRPGSSPWRPRDCGEATQAVVGLDPLGGSIPVEDVIRLSDQEKERRAEGMREFARLLDEEYDAEFGSDHDGDGER